MSNLFFPDLNLAYDYIKTPMYSTQIATSVNGKEIRACMQPQPKFEIILNLPVLSERNDEDEFTRLIDFFNDRRGSFDSFLFKAPDDYKANVIVHGNGSSVYTLNKGSIQYANVKVIPKTIETPLMWNANDQILMWKTDDSSLMWNPKYSYTVSSSGIVTFSESLAYGLSVLIPIEYYYRCRFSEDSQQFTNFCEKLWRGEVTLAASLGNHI